MACFSSTLLGPHSPLFRGRATELDWLVQRCQDEVTAYLVLYGGRQNGKTSLLLRLEACLPPPVRVCRVDFQLIKGADAARTFAFLAAQITLPFKPDPAAVRDGPSLRAFFDQALARPDIPRLVLLLDELGALPAPTREVLAHTLRSFFQARFDHPALNKLLIVFSGGIELYNLVATEASSLHNICEELYLADLGQDEAVALIADGLRGLGCDAALAGWGGRAVYVRAAGHPYLTQKLGSLLEGALRAGATLTPAQIERAARQIQQGNTLLRHIRDDLREHGLEDAARHLLTAPPRFTRLDDGMARLELIGLAKPADERWAARNALLAEVFRERLGLPPVVPPALPPLPTPPPPAEAAPSAPTPAADPPPVPPPAPRDPGPPSSKRAVADEKSAGQSQPLAPPPTREQPAAPQRPVTGLPTRKLDSSETDWRRSRAASLPPPASGLPKRFRLAVVGALVMMVATLIAIAQSWIGGGSTRVPEMVKVSGGAFLMGSSNTDSQADDDENPQHRLELPDFWIGKTEVTNAQFRPFVEGDGYTNRAYWTAAGWDWKEAGEITQPAYWNNAKLNGDTQPVVGISWFEALAYCRWLSKQTGYTFRLPTEAEWEKAARGPDGRIWPWGDTWEAGRANSDEAGTGRTKPVGQYPDGVSPYKALDMAGNVREWCATQWRKDYPYKIEENQWADDYLEADARRVLRGGSWGSGQKDVRGASRDHFDSRHRYSTFGLRVASHTQPGPGS